MMKAWKMIARRSREEDLEYSVIVCLSLGKKEKEKERKKILE